MVALATALLSGAAPAAPPPIAATEGAPFSGQVATWTAACTNPSQVQATIAWGGGSAGSAAGVSQSGSQLSFSGSNAYAEEGGFTGTVTGSYFCDATGTQSFETEFTAAVADAPLTITAGPTLPASVVTGQGVTTTATFTDADPAGTASDYTAEVLWGDNTSSNGTVAAAGSSFAVTAAHTYTAPGRYVVQLRLTDHGDTVLADGFITAVAAQLVTATEGASFSGRVVSTACSPQQPSIDWGDNRTSAGTAASGSVDGTHTYAEDGTYQGTVTYACAGVAGTQSSPFTAEVADARLTARSLALRRAVAGQGFSASLAEFTDADPGGRAGDYTALINWGDGLVSPGTVSAGPNGFGVSGQHAYSSSGHYVLVVEIYDRGGSRASVRQTVDVGLGLPRVGIRAVPRVGNGTGVVSLLLNRPGTLSVGAVRRGHQLLVAARQIRVGGAGPLVLVLKPTSAGRTLLLGAQTLRITAKITFTPILGPRIVHFIPIVFDLQSCSGSTTYTYTGSEQSCVVPPGTTEVKVIAVGGRGGNVSEPCPSQLGCPYGNFGGSGGPGAVVLSGPVAVNPGDTLYIEVGGNGGDTSSNPQLPGGTGRAGAGGWNGGGAGVFPLSLEGSGGGGGASDVQTVSCATVCDQGLGLGVFIALASRVVVAGGGGGGASGGGAGDGGGATQGGSGGFASFNGQGGSQASISGNAGILGLGGGGAIGTAGGAGGADNDGNDCADGANGKLGAGGVGGNYGQSGGYVDGVFVNPYGGGGGGGGYYGGGGGGGGCISLNNTIGAGGGGGGGSSNGPAGTTVQVDTSGSQPYIQVIPLG